MTDILRELRYGGVFDDSTDNDNQNNSSSRGNLLGLSIQQTTQQLDRKYHNMASCIQLLSQKPRSWRALSQVSGITLMFDPAHTVDMISFIALGGIEVLCDVLCDDALFESTVFDAATARIARVALTDIVRLVDEMFIVNGSVANFVLAAWPQVVARVERMLPLDRVRERALSFLEHVISFSGPIWKWWEPAPDGSPSHLMNMLFAGASASSSSSLSPSSPSLKPVSDVTFARLARVLSIAAVPAVVAGPGTEAVAADPHPVCRDRAVTFSSTSLRACQVLVETENGFVIRRIFDILAYSRDMNRNRRPTSSGEGGGGGGTGSFRPQLITTNVGGRAVSGFQLDGAELQRILGQPGGEQPAAGMGDVLQMLMMLGAGGNQAGTTTAASTAQRQLLRQLLGDAAGDSSDRDDSDNSENDENERDPEYSDADEDDFLDNNDNSNGGLPSALSSSADNAILFQRFLDDMQAEIHAEEDPTVDDTANMDWLVGDDLDHDRCFRATNLMISNDNPAWVRSVDVLVRQIHELAPSPADAIEEQAKSNSGGGGGGGGGASADADVEDAASMRNKLKAKTRADEKTIIAAQSEAMYLLNSLISALPHRVFHVLEQVRAMDTLHSLLVWFAVPQHEQQRKEHHSSTNHDASHDNDHSSYRPPTSSVPAAAPPPPPSATLPVVSKCPADLASLSALYRGHASRHEERQRKNIEGSEQHERAWMLRQLCAWQASVEVATIGNAALEEAEEAAWRRNQQLRVIASLLESEDENDDDENANSNSNNDMNMADIIMDDAASVASSHEPDRQGHQHNVETLCAIELAKTIQELWDARSLEECVVVSMSHFREVPAHETSASTSGGAAAATSPSSSSLPRVPVFSASHPDTTAFKSLKLIVDFEIRGAADPCVENLFAFSLESCLRGLCVSERAAVQREVLRAVPHMFDRVLLRSARGTAHLRRHDIPVAGPLPPLDGAVISHRRLDACATLLGDACRYVPENWAVCEIYLSERGLFESAASAGGVSSISYIQNRLLRCAPTMNLFIRAFILTRFMHLLPDPVMMATLPGDWLDQVEMCTSLVAGASAPEPIFISVTERCIESALSIAERILNVRRVLRSTPDISLLPVEQLLEKILSDEVSLPLQPGFNWFAGPARPAVPQRLSQDGQRRAAEWKQRCADAVAANGRDCGARILRQFAPLLSSAFDSILPALLGRLFVSALVEEMETTDKLGTCVTSMLIVAGIRAERGDAAAETLIREACAHHLLRRKKAFARAKRRLANSARRCGPQQQQPSSSSSASHAAISHIIASPSSALLFFEGLYESNRYDSELRKRRARPPRSCLDDVEDEDIAEIEQQLKEDDKKRASCQSCSSSSSNNKIMRDADQGSSGSSSDSADDDAGEAAAVRRSGDGKKSPWCLSCGARSFIRNRVMRVRCAARAFFDTLSVWIAHYARHMRYVSCVAYMTTVDIVTYRETIEFLLPILQSIMHPAKNQ